MLTQRHNGFPALTPDAVPRDAAHHWFRSGDDWCAAVWHQAERPVGRIAVLCPSIAQEHLRGQRHYRVLAGRLAAAGVSTLRFDYPATGNSTGAAIATDDDGPDLAERWTRSIVDAVSHARRRAGGAEVVLVGRRFGALLAARASLDIDHGLAACVLWDPSESGRAHLRELRLREAARLDVLFATELDRHEPGITFQSEGHRFGAATVRGASALSLDGLRPRAGAVHLVGDAQERVLRAVARWNSDALAAPAEITATTDASFDWANPEGSALPEATLDAIVRIASAGALAPTDASPSCVDDDAPREIVHGDDPAVRERLLRFGPADALFGVHSTPSGTGTIATALLILGTGIEPTPGFGDSWSRFAREAAVRGMAVLRMDFSGIGESRVRDGERENVSYQPGRVEDVREGVAWLRARHPGVRVVVTGVCTGAYYAVHAASAGIAVDRVIAINPQLWCTDSSTSSAAPSMDVFLARRSADAARDVGKWVKLLRGGYRLQDVVAAVRTLVVRRFGRATERRVGTSDTLGGGMPRLDFDRLFPVHVPTHLIFSQDDFGYEHLLAHGLAEAQRLFDAPHMRLHLLAGVDHTCSREWMRRRLNEEVLGVLASELVN